MNKDYLVLPELVDEIGLSLDYSLDEMREEGLSTINAFRADLLNYDAILEVFQNNGNPDYKISKYGKQESMILFLNNVLAIFQMQRDNMYANMPSDIGLPFHKEITDFYMTYTAASIFCLQTQMTDMAVVSVAVADLRKHFMEFLIPYIQYL